MLLWLLWDCTVWVQCAAVSILVHRQLSAPMRKSSPIHSCTHDQNHKSTSSTPLSHFYRRAYFELTTQYTLRSAVVHTIPVVTQKIYFETRISQILLTSERERRSNLEFITKILHICCQNRWNSRPTIFLQRNLFQPKKAKRIFYANQLETRPDLWNLASKGQSGNPGDTWTYCPDENHNDALFFR